MPEWLKELFAKQSSLIWYVGSTPTFSDYEENIMFSIDTTAEDNINTNNCNIDTIYEYKISSSVKKIIMYNINEEKEKIGSLILIKDIVKYNTNCIVDYFIDQK